MRINPTNSVALPAVEPQEILPLFNQRIPRGEIPSNWDNLTIPALALGQEIDAVVLALLPDDQVLLELGGAPVQAEGPGDLTPGQNLRLRVEQLIPQLVLHITEAEPRVEVEATRLLRAHLPTHADAGELLEQLISQVQSEAEDWLASPTLDKLKQSLATLVAHETPLAAKDPTASTILDKLQQSIATLLRDGTSPTAENSAVSPILGRLKESIATLLSDETALTAKDSALSPILVKLKQSLATLLPDGTSHIDKDSTVSPILVKLKQSVAALLPDGLPPTVENLKTLMRDGGIFYEAKLFKAAVHEPQTLSQVAEHDLKGLLLAAVKESETGIYSTEFKNAVTAQLQNVETQQAVNLLAQLDGRALQFQIPLFSDGRFSTAAVSVEPDDSRGSNEQKKGTAGYNLLFLLDLDNFGRTRIDAHVAQSELKVIFYVDQESSIKLLKQEIPAFHQILLAMGYRQVLLAAKPLKDIPEEKQQKFDAMAVGAPNSMHLVDVKV